MGRGGVGGSIKTQNETKPRSLPFFPTHLDAVKNGAQDPGPQLHGQRFAGAFDDVADGEARGVFVALNRGGNAIQPNDLPDQPVGADAQHFVHGGAVHGLRHDDGTGDAADVAVGVGREGRKGRSACPFPIARVLCSVSPPTLLYGLRPLPHQTHSRASAVPRVDVEGGEGGGRGARQKRGHAHAPVFTPDHAPARCGLPRPAARVVPTRAPGAG